MIGTLSCLTPALDTVFIQCQDKNTYFCQNEDRALTLRDRSRFHNKFHVVGELRLANKEQTAHMLKLIKQLLVTVHGATVLLVTCQPRYLHQPCCASKATWWILTLLRSQLT